MGPGSKLPNPVQSRQNPVVETLYISTVHQGQKTFIVIGTFRAMTRIMLTLIYQQTERRPIIFIVHSLGGIVVKSVSGLPIDEVVCH